MTGSDPGMAELGVRLIGSLAVVVGLLLLVARFTNRRFRARTGAPIQVVSRQSLTRGSSVAVVTVGARVLVLGTTEQQVTLLAEVDPDEVGLDPDLDVLAAEAPAEGPEGSDSFGELVARVSPVRAVGGAHRATPAPRRSARPAAAGPLAGSVLSAQTWRQAIAAVSGQAAPGSDRHPRAS